VTAPWPDHPRPHRRRAPSRARSHPRRSRSSRRIPSAMQNRTDSPAARTFQNFFHRRVSGLLDQPLSQALRERLVGGGHPSPEHSVGLGRNPLDLHARHGAMSRHRRPIGARAIPDQSTEGARHRATLIPRATNQPTGGVPSVGIEWGLLLHLRRLERAIRHPPVLRSGTPCRTPAAIPRPVDTASEDGSRLFRRRREVRRLGRPGVGGEILETRGRLVGHEATPGVVRFEPATASCGASPLRRRATAGRRRPTASGPRRCGGA